MSSLDKTRPLQVNDKFAIQNFVCIVLFFTGGSGKSGYSSIPWDQLPSLPTPEILCLSIIHLNMATYMADKDVQMLYKL